MLLINLTYCHKILTFVCVKNYMHIFQTQPAQCIKKCFSGDNLPNNLKIAKFSPIFKAGMH